MIAIDTYIIDGLVKVVRGMVGSSKIRDGIRTRMRERRYAIVQRKRICLEFVGIFRSAYFSRKKSQVHNC